jgi:DNA-directed RNA polymerase specialized sigma24 family protein
MNQMTIEEQNWQAIYTKLYSQAKRLAYTQGISRWHGQEYDVSWDITQESICRALEYARKTAAPIQSMDHFLMVIAQHYSKDLRRRECRLVPSTWGQEATFEGRDQIHVGEQAIENAHNEHLYQKLAGEIACFPTKQRQAVLWDLASRMSFDNEPTPLQAAFLASGIHLEKYRAPQLVTQKERNQYAALLHAAYRRLACIAQKKCWVFYEL